MATGALSETAVETMKGNEEDEPVLAARVEGRAKERLLRPLRPQWRVLLGPGPSNVPHRVAAAGALPMISHTDPAFFELLEDIKAGLRYVFQTSNIYTFCITGSGHSAMEAAIVNILADGDVFLVATHGLWGARAATMGANVGARVVQVAPDGLGQVIGLRVFEEALIRHKPKLLYVCHGDSSAGTLQPLEGLGALCRRHNCLLLVDAVASLLSTPLAMDSLQIDVLFTGSQKCLNAPPGLAPISFADRAMDIIRKRDRVSSLYLNVLKIGESWGCADSSYIYHITPAISLLMSLREALAIVVETGLSQIIADSGSMSTYLQQELEKLGLGFLVKSPEQRLPSVLAVKVPEKIDANQVKRFLLDNYRIEIAGGLGPSAGLIWRIGLMGQNATRFNCDVLLAALREALKAARESASRSKL